MAVDSWSGVGLASAGILQRQDMERHQAPGESPGESGTGHVDPDSQATACSLSFCGKWHGSLVRHRLSSRQTGHQLDPLDVPEKLGQEKAVRGHP